MSYLDTIIAKHPPGATRVFGDCPRKRNKTGASMDGASESKTNGAGFGPGHNSGESEPMPDEPAAASTEKLDLLREQIAMAIAAQRVAGVAPGTIGRLGNLQRVKALRSSYLLGAVRFCRRNPLADTRLAILAYVTFLSDNPFGTCRLSVTRMCRLFKRSRETITSGISSLEADGLIGVARKGGMASIYWPVISREMMAADLNPAWIAPALTDPNWSRMVDQSEEETGQGDLTGAGQGGLTGAGQGDLTGWEELVKDRRATGQGSPGPYLSKELKKESNDAAAPAPGVSSEEADRLAASSDGKRAPTKKGGSGKQSKKAPPPEAMEAFNSYIDVAQRHGLPTPKPSEGLLWSMAAVLRKFDGLSGWRKALAKIEANPALRGIGDGFSMKVSLFWLTKAGGENLNKLLSGECDDWGKPRASQSPLVKNGKVVF